MLDPYLQNMSWMQDSDNSLQVECEQLFRKNLHIGRKNALLARILGKTAQLCSLARCIQENGFASRAYRGIQTVPIQAICGTENRSSDFDQCFHPLSERTEDRWIHILKAREKGEILPPVELIQVGEAYFVRDGHHRISVARALGEKYIEAEVIGWQA